MLTRRHEVALVHPVLDRVLALDGAVGPELPTLDDRWPDHRDLTRSVGNPGAFLAWPPRRRPDGRVTDVLLAATDSPDLDGARWIDPATLDEGSRVEVLRALAERRTGPPDDGRADWFRPSWPAEVEDWIAARLVEIGAVRTGPVVPVKI